MNGIFIIHAIHALTANSTLDVLSPFCQTARIYPFWCCGVDFFVGRF